MKNEYKCSFFLLCCCLLASCVTTDKYNELAQVKDYLEQENQRLTSQEAENRDLLAKNRQQKITYDKAQAEIVELKASFNSLNRNYQDLANRYNTLIASNKQIGSGSATDKQFWEETLANKQLELEDKERQMQTLRYTLEQKDKQVQELLQLIRAKEGN